MFQHQRLLGFIFYDADEKAFFTPQVRHHLQVYSELIESLVITEVMPVRMVLATIHLSQTVPR